MRNVFPRVGWPNGVPGERDSMLNSSLRAAGGSSMGQTRFHRGRRCWRSRCRACRFALFGVAVGGMLGTAALIVILHPRSSTMETTNSPPSLPGQLLG